MKASAPEAVLAAHILAFGLPAPELEATFHETRKWRFDFFWRPRALAVEVEGGIWVQGRHSRGAGFEKDCEKYNEAALMGIRVLRVTPGMIQSGQAVQLLVRALQRTLPASPLTCSA